MPLASDADLGYTAGLNVNIVGMRILRLVMEAVTSTGPIRQVFSCLCALNALPVIAGVAVY